MLPVLYGWALPAADQPRRLLGKIAAMSFGIYFLHGPLLRPIAQAIGPHVPADNVVAILLGLSVSALLVLVICWAVLRCAKAIFGRRSRYLFGY
jgi:peptidoglycan/LPS O-acetylase OafA/YrhL